MNVKMWTVSRGAIYVQTAAQALARAAVIKTGADRPNIEDGSLHGTSTQLPESGPWKCIT